MQAPHGAKRSAATALQSPEKIRLGTCIHHAYAAVGGDDFPLRVSLLRHCRSASNTSRILQRGGGRQRLLSCSRRTRLGSIWLMLISTRASSGDHLPFWVVASCYTSMVLGTLMVGGASSKP